MIIELLLSALYGVFNLLTTPINIPSLPEDVSNYLNYIFEYISAGTLILANYVPLVYIGVLFGIIIAIDIGLALYHFVMWVIKKIPMAGMS